MKLVLFLLALFSPLLCLAQGSFKTIHASDLEALQKSGSPFALYDANEESLRGHVGLIPGAHALSSYASYSASELVADKGTPLIFYCANKLCTASHEAAQRAISLGYRNVSVMEDGVLGWKEKGRALVPYRAVAAAGVAPGAREVSPAEAKTLVDTGHAVLLDVREGGERFEVIPKAQWLPLSKKGSPEWLAFVKGLSKDQPVVVHCASGRRARKVAEELSQEGFHASYFKGPDQWKAAGLPVENGPAKQ